MAKQILVTGSAGFIGTNLVKLLLSQGHTVVAIDNFSASEKTKVNPFTKNPKYFFIEGDIINTNVFSKIKTKKIDEIYNLACPASPPRYQNLALETIQVNTIGLMNVLDFAKKHNAKVLHTSTSEIYGDPLVHPQTESYRGNVTTLGPRSCYDEGKRISETICYEYKNKYNLDIKIARIFNTYGPYMDHNDGRVVSNFIIQALQNQDLTIYGDGSQTRSFQYITDLLSGLTKLMKTESAFMGPVNLGNPDEFTIKELADIILTILNLNNKIVYQNLPTDDPKQRRPNISLAQTKLNWQPKTNLQTGLLKTIKAFQRHI